MTELWDGAIFLLQHNQAKWLELKWYELKRKWYELMRINAAGIKKERSLKNWTAEIWLYKMISGKAGMKKEE
ncbi:MAG: hypothetical protein PHR92_18160 [Lachnospiraceae bacterium]|nr:hypothetical protein [Lachnospiraceae bacterium]